MAFTISYTPASPQFVVVGEFATIVAELLWEAGDTPPTANDVLVFSLPQPQPIPTGTVKPATEPFVFPFRVGILGSVNLEQRRARFQFILSALAVGNVELACNLESQPTVSLPNYNFIVTPADYTLATTGFDQIAIPIASSDTLDTTAADEFKSTIVVTAMTTDPTPVPAVGVDVTFIVSNPAPFAASQAGRFFDMTSGSQAGISFKASTTGQTASFTLKTNASGTVTVVAVSNTRSGFIHCKVTGGINTVPRPRLYMYAQPSGRSKFLGPDILLPFGSPADFDTTRYIQPTFPILINANVVPTEFCVAILNNKYQQDRPTSTFIGGNATYDGKTEDLNVSRTGEDNVLFYAVSDNGQLVNSQIFRFTTQDSKTGPIQGVQFGPFDRPISSHLSLRDIVPTLTTIIPLAADQAKLTAANRSLLVSPNSYVVRAILTGWNLNQVFETRSAAYPQTIDDFAAVTDTKAINVFTEFGNLGRSPDGSTQATWELWYTYHTGPNGTGEQIGESIHTTGTMFTRAMEI